MSSTMAPAYLSCDGITSVDSSTKRPMMTEPSIAPQIEPRPPTQVAAKISSSTCAPSW